MLTEKAETTNVTPADTAPIPAKATATPADTAPTPVTPAPTTANTTAKRPRMEWIDAMRGFTMILVVAYHVCITTFAEDPKDSAYLTIFVLFRMPLFFFISGFFSYSTKVEWTAPTLAKLVWKKLRMQMLPTVIFMLLFAVVIERHFWPTITRFLESPTKGGYWFTYVLLLMFVIYYLFAYVESGFSAWLKARRLGWLPITLFWLLWLGAYASWYMPSWFSYPKSEMLKLTSFGQVIQYFHFFLAGNIARRYWPEVQRLFDTRWFLPVLIGVATVCLCEFVKWHTLHFQWTNLPRTLCMYSLMTIVIIYFRQHADLFSKKTALGRGLQYIGVRTLDVYLIHFIFLPRLHFVGPWLKTLKNNFAIDITLSFVGAMLVIAISLIVSSIIRTSPVLKFYIFGRK